MTTSTLVQVIVGAMLLVAGAGIFAWWGKWRKMRTPPAWKKRLDEFQAQPARVDRFRHRGFEDWLSLPERRDVELWIPRKPTTPLRVGDDVNGDVVVQQAARDCWAAASIAAVAEHRPDKIEECLAEPGEDPEVVNVRLHVDGLSEEVRVERKLHSARFKGQHIESALHLRANDVLWPAMVAYALYAELPGVLKAANRGVMPTTSPSCSRCWWVNRP